MPLTHQDALAAAKTFAGGARWSAGDNGHFKFQSPLMVAGLVVEGLFFYARASEREPGRDVAMMIVNAAADRPRTVIDRIDWNPLTPHSNKNVGPPETRLQIVRGSHRHNYFDNLSSSGELLKGNLPVAREIADALPSFGSLASYVRTVYKLAGVDLLPPPPWNEDLFG